MQLNQFICPPLEWPPGIIWKKKTVNCLSLIHLFRCFFCLNVSKDDAGTISSRGAFCSDFTLAEKKFLHTSLKTFFFSLYCWLITWFKQDLKFNVLYVVHEFIYTSVISAKKPAVTQRGQFNRLGLSFIIFVTQMGEKSFVALLWTLWPQCPSWKNSNMDTTL